MIITCSLHCQYRCDGPKNDFQCDHNLTRNRLNVHIDDDGQGEVTVHNITINTKSKIHAEIFYKMTLCCK
ncbi:hypothetical protein KVMX100_120741 [Klebsiella variicola]|nr:hypothetical protein KVMX100_120741 [Klebsiella variicola]